MVIFHFANGWFTATGIIQQGLAPLHWELTLDRDAGKAMAMVFLKFETYQFWDVCRGFAKGLPTLNNA